jgi:hypothetical protein
MSINKSRLIFLLPIILILGGFLRLLFLITPSMDSDQAVTGLMARHILGGEFPFFFYAQDYCGSIEAYLVSIFFFFFGVSRFILDLTICIESLLFILLLYYLARSIFDEKIALLSAVFAAFSSYFLIFHSVLARAAYIEIAIIGVLLFIFGHRIIYRDARTSRNFFFLGFLCGLGMWTHLLILFYLPPIFLLLFLKDKWFWVRRTILFFLLGLILGGLPLWVHNTIHLLATWHFLMDTPGGSAAVSTSLKEFFLYRFPEALGVRFNETQRFFIPFFSFPLYIGYLIVFLFLFLSHWKHFVNMIKFRINQNTGLDLFLLFLLFFPFIFAFSGFASSHTSRYLVPLFSGLPILFAVFTDRLKSCSFGIAFLFLLLHLFSNIYGTIKVLPLFSNEQTRNYQQARKIDQDLFSFLRERKIKSVYTPDYWISVQLTFDSREEIIFAQPVGDRYPPFTWLTDRDSHPAFLFRGGNKEFEETLKSIGGTYQKSHISKYSLYYNFSPPPYRYTELLPANWQATATHNPESATNVFDRDLTTGWSSGINQLPGIVLQVDLRTIIPNLGRITLLSGNPGDLPRDLRLEISPDGRQWRTIREIHGYWGGLFWSGPHPFFRPQDGRMDITFPPQAGRYVRLAQLGRDPTCAWTVSECLFYQAQPESKQTTDNFGKLIPFLKQFDVARIYTTPWIQSQFPWEWQTEQWALISQEGKEGLFQTLSKPVFIVYKENVAGLAHFLTNNLGRPFKKYEIGDQVVFSLPSSSEDYHLLSAKGWRFQTNFNPGKAYLAADGKLTTRWSTDRPQEPGTFFQINLGRLERVARLRLLAGNSRKDFPRGFSIQSSTDGQNWSSLNPVLSPVSLHWTGETLMKGSGPDLDFIFPPTPMRLLKIIQTGKDRVYYWSIHEIELYNK